MSAIPSTSSPKSPVVGESSHSSPQMSPATRRAALEMDTLTLPPSTIAKTPPIEETPPPVLNLGDGDISYKGLCSFVDDTLNYLGRHRINFIEERDRYEDVRPFAFNQVRIDGGATGLNGSWISYPENDPYVINPYIPAKYIAISAPSPSNFFPFMRMVQQEAIPLIISLTAFKEWGKVKADPYLPYEEDYVATNDGEDFRVLCTKVHPSINLAEEWVLERRDFELTLKGSSTPHPFTQLHLPHWLDFSAGAVEGIANLVLYIHDYCKERNILAPIVVHCSGGVGRAGTFLNCKEVYERLLSDREVRIFDIAAQSRLQRRHLGGTHGQYEMVYRVFEHLRNRQLNIQED